MAASVVTVTGEAVPPLPSHTQLTLVNATQQRVDDYVSFKGVRVDPMPEG